MSRELVYTGFMSLDGVVDSPGGTTEGHRSGGWVMDTEFVPEAFALKGEELDDTTALMFGRRSYEVFAPFWRASDDHAAYKDPPKYVVSTTLTDADLIDRYNLLVFPVLLGAGKSLFSRDDRDKRQLRLRESESYSNGVTKLIYDVVY
jgi:dihydrofolate reductase